MRTPLAERLWSRVVTMPNGCMEWQGARTDDGYGRIWRGGPGVTKARTHRLAWELAHGPIPEGMHVLHRCDNPPCCNPEHLWLGTNAENMADRNAKGRQARRETHSRWKYTDAQIAEIRRLSAQGWSRKSVAEHIGCSRQLVTNVVAGRSRVVTGMVDRTWAEFYRSGS